MRVTGLCLHPIKSCHRVEVDRATVGPYGLVGDRMWQVVGGEKGGFITQRTHPALARVHPEVVGGGVVVRAEGMPDLEVAAPASAEVEAPTYSGVVKVGDGGDEAAAWFARYLAIPDARLVGIAPGYQRHDAELFATQSNLGDVAPVLVVNEASHRYLSERATEPFPIERFRGNVVVAGDEPWEEETWRSLRVGAAAVRVEIPWPRCAMPQVDQETGDRHREPALVLKAHRWCPALPDAPPLLQMLLCGNGLFGMASSIEPVGAEIAVGDPIEVLETQPRLVPL